MENVQERAFGESSSIAAARVYLMAGLCLLAGLAIGYIFHGSVSESSGSQAAAPAAGATANAGMIAGHMPTLEQMKHMADKQAAPLLEKLKNDPNDGALLVQIGGIYHSTHQFKEAAAYYGKAVQVDPKNDAYRTKLALSLYRSGDADGAITQLSQVLSNDPRDANALFDLGMIRLEAKHDKRGALDAWQKLLKSNPNLSADRKATVQKLISHVTASAGDQRAMRGRAQ